MNDDNNNDSDKYTNDNTNHNNDTTNNTATRTHLLRVLGFRVQGLQPKITLSPKP